MFDIGWTEMLMVAVVAILVVGPKDLPQMLRAFGKTMANVRRMAGDFKKTFDDAMDEAEISDLKNATKMDEFAPLADAKKSMEEFQKSVKDTMSETADKASEGLEVVDEIEAPAVMPEPAVAKTKPATKKAPAKKAPAKKASVKKAPASKPAAKTAAKPRSKKPAPATAAKAAKGAKA